MENYHKFAATMRKIVKAREEAAMEEGAEDARGSIELQLFSVQLEIYLFIYFGKYLYMLHIVVYIFF